ncbi:hypothetical protein J4Q44_G00211230 [Coregonus suidteri]|uniref:Uncharacterized protein n=1 Tax=Coregonus suidteri TaxID=861788 RepID=A0AAN8R032_9TELE
MIMIHQLKIDCVFSPPHSANEDRNKWMLHVPGLSTRRQRNNAAFSGRPDNRFEATWLQCPQPKNQAPDTPGPPEHPRAAVCTEVTSPEDPSRERLAG